MLLLLLLLAFAGCGGDDDGGASGQTAEELLKRGFSTDVETGVFELDAEVELDGGGLLNGVLRLSAEGPFRAAETPTQMPDLDMRFEMSGVGQEFSGRAIVTRENAWVEYGGQSYEVGEMLWAQALSALQAQGQEPQTLEELGMDPLRWVSDPEVAGEEDVDGEPATKVTGTLDVEAMLRDLSQVPGASGQIPEGALDQVSGAVSDVSFETWIGDDGIWRRITAAADFDVPEEEQQGSAGVEGGSVSVDIRLSEPNQDVEIEGPSQARPIEELLQTLGIPPELFLGPGFAAPTPG